MPSREMIGVDSGMIAILGAGPVATREWYPSSGLMCVETGKVHLAGLDFHRWDEVYGPIDTSPNRSIETGRCIAIDLRASEGAKIPYNYAGACMASRHESGGIIHAGTIPAGFVISTLDGDGWFELGPNPDRPGGMFLRARDGDFEQAATETHVDMQTLLCISPDAAVVMVGDPCNPDKCHTFDAAGFSHVALSVSNVSVKFALL